MAFKKKETTKEFKIGGVNIIIGQKYVLDHIADGGAPEGMKKLGAKKFPFEGSGVNDCINFDLTKNVYDTGFYETSYCLSQYSPEERAALVPIYNEQIKKPFEEFRNEDLNHSDKNDFWKNYRYEAFVNKEFDTNKPDELFNLFQIIIQGVACDKNEKNPFYRSGSQFTIANPQVTKNKNKERNKKKLSAITTLNLLVTGDRAKLDLVLQFMGKKPADNIDDDDLTYIYYEVINDPTSGLDFAERFLETCEEYETESGKLKMEYFYVINKLIGLRKIKKDRRGYVTEHGDLFLGNTPQDIAKFCLNTDSSQAKAIEELIEQNPSVSREV